MQELTRPDTLINKLTEIASAELVVAAKVLRCANSAFYGIVRKIHTVHHAITMLGTDAIKEITFDLYFYTYSKKYSATSTQFFDRY